DIAAFLVAEIAQALPKRLHEVGLESRRGVSQEPYPVHRTRRLRPRWRGPRKRAGQADEKFSACVHSITSWRGRPGTVGISASKVGLDPALQPEQIHQKLVAPGREGVDVAAGGLVGDAGDEA